MTSVFLSYAREDLDFVRRLHDVLSRLGHTVAWDQDHGVIPVSSLYRDEISAAIAAAEKFVFVISPDSLDSGPCGDEVAAALECRKQVIPMLRRPVRPGQPVPAAVADRNWIFFDDDARFDAGLAELNAVLGTDLEWVHEHSWLLGRARQWSEGGSERGALLRGADLRRGEALLAGADAHPDTPPTATQRQYVTASRRASDRFTRNLRTALAGGLVIALALSAFALVQRASAISERNQAIAQRNAAIASAITAETSGLDTTDPSLAAELNLAAYRINPTPTLMNRLLATENTPLATVLPGLRPGPGATKPTNDIAFSRRRHLLAVATSVGTVVLWDVTSPQRPRLLDRLRLGTGSVSAVAFSPDSLQLAAQTADGRLSLWGLGDSAHPAALGSTATGSAHISTLSFSPDGGVLADATDDTVLLWNVVTPGHFSALPPLPPARSQSVQALAFSRSGRLLAVGYSSGTIRLYSMTDPARPALLSSVSISAKDLPTAIAFGAPDGAVLMVGSYDGKLDSWLVRDPARPQAMPTAVAGTVPVYGLAYSPDGRTFAAGCSDGTLSLWDYSFSTGPSELTRAQAGMSEGLTSVAYSPDGSVIATADGDGTARVWTPPRTLLRPSPRMVLDVSVTPDGRTAAITNDYVWLVSIAGAASAATVDARLSLPGQMIRSATLSPARHLLAIATDSGSIALWNVADPTRPTSLGTLSSGLAQADSVAFSVDGRTMAAGDVTVNAQDDWSWAARAWDVSTPAHPRVLAAVGGPTQSIGDWEGQFSPAARTVAFTTDGDPGLRLWNLVGPQRPPAVSTTPIGTLAGTSVAFSADGRQLAAGDIDGSVRVWRTAGQAGLTRTATLRAGTQPVDSVTFADSGRVVVAVDNAGALWLWDLPAATSAAAEGEVLAPGVGGDAVAYLAAAGGLLVTGGLNGAVELWNLNPAAAVARICATTRNELTASVWQKYIPQLPYAPACG